MYELNMIYEELKGDITAFIKLYRSAKAAGMNEQDVINLLKIADYDNLPALEYRYKALKQEVNSLEIKKLNSRDNLATVNNDETEAKGKIEALKLDAALTMTLKIGL